MRRLLICGDRNWRNYERILACVHKANLTERIACVIEGGASGADIMGKRAAEESGVTVAHFPADWKRYGRAAGSIRNQQMLDEGHPTEVWAFHNDFANSKGTRDMVRRALIAGATTWLITETSCMLLGGVPRLL